MDIHQKLVNVSEKLLSADACFDVLQKETNSENPDRITSAFESISQVALRISEFDDKWNDMVLAALERSTNGLQSTNHKEKSTALLRLLYKLKNIDRLVERACDIVEIYPQDPCAYEWICKIYVDKFDDETFNIQVIILTLCFHCDILENIF